MPAPGSIVTTARRLGPPAGVVPAAATAFFPSLVDRGPTDWQRITSIGDLNTIYGSIPAAGAGLLAGLSAYFELGGQVAYVGRLLGPDAATAQITLENDDEEASLKVWARWQGSYGNAFTVAVAAGTDEDTVKITIDETDAPGEPTVLDNIATVQEAADRLNAEAGALVTADVLGHGSDPLGLAAAAHLTGGLDDLGNMNLADAFPPADLGAGVVVGLTPAGVAALEPADAYRFAGLANSTRRLVFLSDSGGDGSYDTAEEMHADLAEFAANVLGHASELNPTDFVGAVTDAADRLSGIGAFWPNVAVLVNGQPTGVTSVGPVVAGLRAKAHTVSGPHRAPAGEAGILPRNTVVAGGEGGDAYASAVDALNINAIRNIGDTVRVYGYRPIGLGVGGAGLESADADWPLLTHRDTVNVAAAEADVIAERYVFRPIDPRGHVFADLRRDLLGLGERMAAAGSLYADVDPVTRVVADPGYAVDTGPNVNTAETIAAGEIRARMSIRVTPTAPFVNITIVKAALTGAL